MNNVHACINNNFVTCVVERFAVRSSLFVHVVLHCYEWFCRRLVTQQAYLVNDERQKVVDWRRLVCSV